jgi:hypothetical protein
MAVYPDVAVMPIEVHRAQMELTAAYINELEEQNKRLIEELEIYKQYVTLTKFEKYPHE